MKFTPFCCSIGMPPKKKKKVTKKKEEEDEAIILKKIYYSTKHPAAYGSVKNLMKASGLSKRVVEQWLRSQPTYTLHKRRRKRFPMSRYYVRKPNLQFQADLVDYQKFASHNDGYKYMLMITDLFYTQSLGFSVENEIWA